MSSNSQDKSFAQPDCAHPQIIIDPLFGAAQTRKELMRIVASYPFQVCPNCGGLTPELKIHVQDRTMTFCCFEVREYVEVEPHLRTDTKVVQQTDYQKLKKFIEGKGVCV